MSSRFLWIARASLTLLILAAGGLYFWSTIDSTELTAVILQSDWVRVVVLAPFLIIAIWILRAVRWGLCVSASGGEIQPLKLYTFVGASLGLAAVTPAQIGEAAKIYWHREHFDTMRAAGAFAAERLADLIVLSVLTAGAIFVLGWGERAYLIVVVVIAIAIAALLVIIAIQPWLARISWVDRAMDGVKMIVANRLRLTLFIVLTVLSWLLTGTLWMVGFTAVGESPGMITLFAVLGFATFTSIASMVPGSVGVSELSITALLTLQGMVPEVALAAALMIRLIGLEILALGVIHYLAALVIQRNEHRLDSH
ncbi:MAG: lysylphosphatidylglycerol synthase transmembrane domain-containing protein [Maricaulis sp.]|nr:lysylphosphatidylglycerol synthase transmembrane domain-containing protein [Maricaulis sp.]